MEEYDVESILDMYESDYVREPGSIPIGPRGMVGEITDEQTQFNRPIYQTPGGERVSEKSTTLFLNGNWMNVPSIHGGKSFNEAELRRMIKLGNIEPTSVHKSKDEAETAAKARSASMADGGRIPFRLGKKALPKNIRLTEFDRYRFSSEASGKYFSKTFPKGTKLEEVKKFRDEYLKQFGIEKGQLRPVNPERGKYKSVKGQKHIKFNGVNYQVNIQRGGEGAQYFSSLKDAVKERDALVKEYPPKTIAEYNIKEKPKQVNADILELYKDPTIKNIFKTGKLTDEAIAQAAKILGVNKGSAIDRLEQLSSALMGVRKNVPGIKPAFTENAKNIVLQLPVRAKSTAELATGIPLEGESIKVPKDEIRRNTKYPTDMFDIDEARATATGLKRNTSPYSIFGQIIDKNVNRIAKGGFEGAGWDAKAGTLEKNLDEAIQKFGANSKEARAAKIKYNQAATEFENEVNSKKLRGAKRVRIPRISLDAPSQTIANWEKFNKKYKNIFNENFKTKKYSFVIPKDLKTIPELRDEVLNPKSSTYKTMINHLKEGFNEYDEKKLFQKIKTMTDKAPDAVKKIMRLIPRIAQVDDFETNRFASADNIMTSGVEYVDDVEETFAEKNPLTTGAALTGAGTAGVLKAAGVPIKKALGKAFRTLGTRAAAVPLAGYTIYDNLKKGENVADAVVDPLVGAELMLPNLFKENVAKITSNPTLQKLLKIGKYGRMFTPIGAGITAAGLGIDAYKYGKKRIAELQAMSPEERAKLAQERDDFSFGEYSGAAEGGIASLNVKK
jgi:hypothetical protein